MGRLFLEGRAAAAIRRKGVGRCCQIGHFIRPFLRTWSCFLVAIFLLVRAARVRIHARVMRYSMVASPFRAATRHFRRSLAYSGTHAVATAWVHSLSTLPGVRWRRAPN